MGATVSKQRVEVQIAERPFNRLRVIGPVPCSDDRHWPDLHFCVVDGDINAARSLLLTGVDPNFRSADGYFALYLSVSRPDGGTEMLNLLLSFGANHQMALPDGRQGAGSTSLHMAVRQQNLLAVKKLLESGALPNLKDAFGHGPLHLARRPELVRELNNHGADIESRDASGATALYLAIRHGQLELARALLKIGADPDAPALHRVGGSPRQVALKSEASAIFVDHDHQRLSSALRQTFSKAAFRRL